MARAENIVVKVVADTREYEAALARVSASIGEVARQIGQVLLPAVEEFSATLRAWYNSWPGMPYTKPSLWDADQMKADRG